MAVQPHVVYMLVCRNKKFKGKVYIGYTVDPSRRLKQHNQGKEFGGARKTNNKGPWDMIVFVSGFPNEISALRFEWTWQHPNQSRRLRLNDLRKKTRNDSVVDYHLYLLETMLTLGPWNRLHLNVHWLKEEFSKELVLIPEQINILNSSVIPAVSSQQLLYDDNCLFCDTPVDESNRTLCGNVDCSMTSHFVCLAKYILGDSIHVVPIEKHCPLCDNKLIWGNIVQLKNSSRH